MAKATQNRPANSTKEEVAPAKKERQTKQYTVAEVLAEVVKRINAGTQTKEEILEEVGELVGLTPKSLEQFYSKRKAALLKEKKISLPVFPSNRGREMGDIDALAALIAQNSGEEEQS